jgi:hypothetical protein
MHKDNARLVSFIRLLDGAPRPIKLGLNGGVIAKAAGSKIVHVGAMQWHERR